ncbi:exonuclease V isoform X2 [Electrophorus electricus]|uniref:exonuclease V isoform X2 n=1 Tax=Electrophorus electricus TaxID=8005 RepID=UPI0015D090BE|nr:exonuclease V isoform X2 [Electrophorus electricus]
MERAFEDWGDISDSDLLYSAAQVEKQEPYESVTCQKDDTRNSNQVTVPESLHRACKTEERSEQSPFKMDEERGLKRKCRPEGGRRRQLRFWKRHLSVTTLCQQAWCEMKLEYDFQKPHIRREEQKRTEVQTGATIHLVRELEIQEVISINTQSREDFVAVALLNMLHMIPLLEGELVLNELKTRRDDSLPRTAQTECHNFQVGLYKLLFDAMVRGELRREHLVDNPQLCGSRGLGDGVLAHTAKAGLRVATFGEMVDAFLQSLSASVLPCIDLLQVEYRHQASCGLIGTRVASFDATKLRADLRDYLAYWRGQRESRGVDIEEAWKCRFCLHREICAWRKSGYQLPDTPHASKRSKLTDTP